MPKANFYLLSQEQPAEQHVFACRLCEKILSQNLNAYIHTDTEEQAQYMDDLLWSYRPESFLPHCLVGTETDEEVSIVIGYADKYQQGFDVLINLSREVPDFHSEFKRIVEIISAAEAAKALGRERWKYYKEAGYEVQKHEA